MRLENVQSSENEDEAHCIVLYKLSEGLTWKQSFTFCIFLSRLAFYFFSTESTYDGYF